MVISATGDLSRVSLSKITTSLCVVFRVDIVEGQFGVMFVYLITAVFGPDVWDIEVCCS